MRSKVVLIGAFGSFSALTTAASMLMGKGIDWTYVGIGFAAGCVVGTITLLRSSPEEVWAALRRPLR